MTRILLCLLWAGITSAATLEERIEAGLGHPPRARLLTSRSYYGRRQKPTEGRRSSCVAFVQVCLPPLPRFSSSPDRHVADFERIRASARIRGWPAPAGNLLAAAGVGRAQAAAEFLRALRVI
jgi:hypothetical protein